jgi:hypothetical protein
MALLDLVRQFAKAREEADQYVPQGALDRIGGLLDK